MKEQDFLEIIKNETKSNYIGDDCAHIEELGIVITQDNFVEDVHFKTDWATPYQIGYKATVVNISDVLASGATPVFLTVGLSLPRNIDDYFSVLISVFLYVLYFMYQYMQNVFKSWTASMVI